MRSCYGGTYYYFIDSTYFLSVDTTCGFFFDKCYQFGEMERDKVDFFRFFFWKILVPLILKAMAGRGYNRMNQMDKNL